MNDEMPREKIIRLIKDAVARKSTGTVYIRTDLKHMVIIGLKDGEIVTLLSGPKRGVKAIPVLAGMRAGVLRLEETVVPFHLDELPRTDALLEMLEQGGADSRQGSAIAPHAASRAGDAAFEKEAVRKVLCPLLTEYMGPISSIMCADALAGLGDSADVVQLRSAIDQMAAEIGNAEEAKQFTQRAAQQLKL